MAPIIFQTADVDRVPRYQPFFSELIPCGFPLPSEGIEDQPLDLHTYCVKRPASTFFIRCDGLSMIDAGIAPRDLLVVDCSVSPVHGSIVVARVDGEFTVKRLQLHPVPALLPMNPDFPVMQIDPELLEIFGVVTFGVRDYLHVSA